MRVPTILDVVQAVSPIVVAVRRVWSRLFGPSTQKSDEETGKP